MGNQPPDPPSQKDVSPRAEKLGSLGVEKAKSALLTAYEELVDTLAPVVTSIDSDKAMGTGSLVGQYMKAIERVAELKAEMGESEGTPLDELAKRRAAKGAPQVGRQRR